MKDLNLLYKIDPNFRTIFLPAFLLIVLVGLLLLSINVGYSQVTAQIDDLDDLGMQEQQLTTKLNILRNVQEGLLEYTNASLVAVPDKAPTTWSLSLLRKLISDNSLQVMNATANKENGQSKELSNVKINLEVSGSLTDILNFVESTGKTAPILKSNRVDIGSESQGNYNANIQLTTFWSELPKRIPALDEPITNLSDNEVSLLVDIKDLLRPEFTILEPQEGGVRENPFRTQQ